MSEKASDLSQEVYEREARYMEARRRQAEDFNDLVFTIPEEKEGVRKTMKTLWNTEPDRLLNPGKLAKLKEKDKLVFDEITSYYMDYLKSRLGIE